MASRIAFRASTLARAQAGPLATRTAFRSSSRRAYSTPTPGASSSSSSSNGLIFGALAAAAAAGGAYYFLGTDATPADRVKELKTAGKGAASAAEEKLGLRRPQEDYQKVYNKIADTLEVDDYDGE